MASRFSYGELRREAEREVKMRREVYGRRGLDKLHRNRLAMMEEIVEVLRELEKVERLPVF